MICIRLPCYHMPVCIPHLFTVVHWGAASACAQCKCRTTQLHSFCRVQQPIKMICFAVMNTWRLHVNTALSVEPLLLTPVLRRCHMAGINYKLYTAAMSSCQWCCPNPEVVQILNAMLDHGYHIYLPVKITSRYYYKGQYQLLSMGLSNVGMITITD